MKAFILWLDEFFSIEDEKKPGPIEHWNHDL